MSDSRTLGSLMPGDAEARSVLRQRADSLAVEPHQEVASDTLAILRFRLGPEWYAVRVDEVREIFHDYTLTSMPCVPSHIRGVVSVRGEILSVTDPAMMMQLGRVEIDGSVMPPAVVVVLGDLATALIVDEIGDIIEVETAALEPPISTIDRSQAEYISGTIHDADSLIGVLSIDKVLEPVVTGARHERQ